MIPHLALPFRIVDGAAAVTEQGSFEEIRDCVSAIVRYPHGSRPESPTFGNPDQTFVESAPESEFVRAAVAEWEPRADVEVDGADVVDLVLSTITVGIRPGREASGA